MNIMFLASFHLTIASTGEVVAAVVIGVTVALLGYFLVKEVQKSSSRPPASTRHHYVGSFTVAPDRVARGQSILFTYELQDGGTGTMRPADGISIAFAITPGNAAQIVRLNSTTVNAPTGTEVTSNAGLIQVMVVGVTPSDAKLTASVTGGATPSVVETAFLVTQ